MNRPPTGGRRQVGTSRGGGAPRTGVGSRAGMRTRSGAAAGSGQRAGELASQLQLSSRPITQQGLAAPKTGMHGPERGVYDRSYYMGLLRGKITEIKAAIRELTTQTDAYNMDQATYMSATKQAEQLAAELKSEQGTLTDLNMIVEMMNTNTDMAEIGRRTARIKAANDRETHDLESIFMEKSRKEREIAELESGVEQEKKTAEGIVSDMSEDMKHRYQELRRVNNEQSALLESQQLEMDELQSQVDQLRDEVVQNSPKHKSAQLQQQILELEAKHAMAKKELQRDMKETPEEERARLLDQVRKNNQEVSAMEKLLKELQQKRDKLQDDLQDIESKFDDEFDEKLRKFKQLSAKQQRIRAFLADYPSRLKSERSRTQEFSVTIAQKLESNSKRIDAVEKLPSAEDLQGMQDELNYKVEAMVHSGTTSDDLQKEHEQLKQTLTRFDATERRLVREREGLQTQNEKLKTELAVCRNIDGLRAEADERRKQLVKLQSSLEVQTKAFQQRLNMVAQWSEEKNSKLSSDDTYKQLQVMEKQWQTKVMANSTMREYIAMRSSETNYQPIVADVKQQLSQHNEDITKSVARQLAANRMLRDY